MSNAADIANIGRDFFYNKSGTNIADGETIQTPVDDPNIATARAMAITPLPGPADPASINANITGAYDDGVVIPQFVTCNSRFASIITTDAVNVECLGRHAVEWGSLLNFADDGICVKIDGKSRVAPRINALVPLGLNGIGFAISGECDDIFPVLVEGELRGVGATAFKHTAKSPSPIVYTADDIEFFNTGQTIIDFDPLPGGSETIFNLSACQPSVAFDTSGSKIIDAKSGIAVVDGDVLSAETLSIVRNTAQLTLRAQAAAGSTLIEDGGGAIYNGIGIHIGSIETQGSGNIVALLGQATGNVNIGVGSSSFYNARVLFGDLNVDGLLFVDIPAHIGQITGSGIINGIINGIPYGNNWHDYKFVENLAFESTNNDYDADPVTKLDDTVELQGGLYEVRIGFDACIDATNRQAVVGCFINDDIIDTEFIKESKDVDDFLYLSKILPMVLPAGTNTIRVDYGKRGGGGVAEACIANVRVIFNRKG